MTRCARSLFAVLLFSTLVQPLSGQDLPRARPEEVGLSTQRLERLTSTFQKYVDDNRLAGAVVLVARRGKVAYLHAFGARDRESQAKMREDAIFRIASQSKALVSVAAMILQEEGALLIGDPVSKYLPEFQKTTVAVAKTGGGYDVVDARRPITIRDLLTHTAGIGYGGGPARDKWAEAKIQGWYFADRDEPIAATVARMAALPFDAQPGERYVYGYATDVLGVVIERVAGVPLDEFLRQRVFEPLEMHDTHFYLPPSKAERLAAVYTLRAGRLERSASGAGMNTQGQYVDGPRRSMSGGAGLVSSAHDYARFLQMLLNGGVLDGRRLLSPRTIALMTTDHVGKLFSTGWRVPGAGFGLGFEVL